MIFGRLESQILARFEEENGGQLLVATLCLLEVSARGLLEVELLAILGDEEHLMPTKSASDARNDQANDDKDSDEKSTFLSY